MSNFLKAMTVGWFVNLMLFTLSVFLYNYFNHIGHWSTDAWLVMANTTGLTKAVLSVAIMINITEHGINGLKKKGK